MAEEIKFDSKELETLQKIQKTYFDVQNSFGQVKIAKINLQQQTDDIFKYEEELHEKFLETRKSEKDFVDEITKKYGDGRVNLETGTFIPVNEKK